MTVPQRHWAGWVSIEVPEGEPVYLRADEAQVIGPTMVTVTKMYPMRTRTVTLRGGVQVVIVDAPDNLTKLGF